MEQFTINCTPEQTKKAYELGAPINFEMEVSYDYETMEPNGYEDIKMGEDGEPILIPPTAEQMIGWLEEQESIKDIVIAKPFKWIFIVCNEIGYHSTGEGYETRKEATLAAIDAELDYLASRQK